MLPGGVDEDNRVGVDEDNRVGVVVDAAEVLMPEYAVIEHEDGKIFAWAAARSWNAYRPYMCKPYNVHVEDGHEKRCVWCGIPAFRAAQAQG
jgi:hypothetical protein